VKPEDLPTKKKLVAELLKRLGVIEEKDTGQVIIHLNEGGVCKITKQIDVK
jgi:hypothetical protein